MVEIRGNRFAVRFIRDQSRNSIRDQSRNFIGDLSRNFIRDQSGNVESGLVLIPLLILVLSTLQISMGVLNRNLASHDTQSSVVKSSLFNLDAQPSTNSSASITSSMTGYGLTPDAPRLLSGGGAIYIGRRDFRLPSITPLLPGGDGFTSIGLSLGESP